MAGHSKGAWETVYKTIYQRERSWAYAISRAVVTQKPITVWEVIMPVLLIFNFARSRSDREAIVQSLLFTKELALKAALDMAKNNRSRGNVTSGIEEKTRALLTSVKDGIYSEAIRNRQLKEIDLLIDHYLRLFHAENGAYADLVLRAYRDREHYEAFLGRLSEAEKAVNRAAMETLGPRGSPAIVSIMEETTDRVRKAEVEKFFGSGD